ncbi:site-specific integrase [Solwaraspora sp. WMMD1047]|uniref:tyrosine-type recombinase/integrase n=1 Tax=Solwaraspora sp. WMMD1047 TaxID=3016102 RepID=UPI002417237E|nr:site-specific integrase [Solwaraspora sp. WMMD1047]MDG4833055.1 site-specific integrase [Solwaraspora sp. WMMD1047]
MTVHRDPKRKTWYYVLDLPRGDDRKRRQKWCRGFSSETLAKRAEELARKQFGQAELAADGTVAAELLKWLEERELDVALTTLANYRHAVMKYVIPYLGARQLYDLDKRAINDLYRTLLKRGGRKGEGLSAETVRHVHRTLMKALKDLGVAVEGVRQPRPADRETHGRKGVWTAAQCATFLAHAAGDRLYAAWVLVVVCGMRRGEIAGLKWPKVDLDKRLIHIHWQRAVASGEVAGGIVEKEPKGKSKRSIFVGTALARVLSDHSDQQGKEIAAAGVAYQELGYVFCKEDGTPYHPKYFTDRFRALCLAAGVPVIVLHDGRHTSATVGADHGVPRHAMQKRLGHARATMTDEVYTHVLPESERRAAEIMEEAILGSPPAE